MLATSFVTKLTDVDTTDKEGVGKIRFQGGKWYKYVKFMNHAATVAAGAGSLVAYFALTGYSTHRVVADVTDADAAVFGAGATLATITGTLDVAYYVWIQVMGVITLDTAVTSGAAGSPFYLSGTDKTGAIMSAATQARVGTSVNTTTLVCLQCPF